MVEPTTLGLRRDHVLAEMQTEHDEAGHVEGDVRDCWICLRRYGLDEPAEPRIQGMAPADWERLGHEADEIRAPAASRGPR